MAKKNRTWSRKVESGIVSTYLAATPEDIDAGLHWYQLAHNEAELLSIRYGVTIEAAAGVIAAISPGSAWGRNVIDAGRFIAAFVTQSELPNVGVYGSDGRKKAERILAGESPLDVLGGPKVRAFYADILNPLDTEAVTVDRHAKGLAYGYASKRKGFASDDKLSSVKSWENEYLAWHYRVIARRYDLIPSQLQAITWVAWKRINEGRGVAGE